MVRALIIPMIEKCHAAYQMVKYFPSEIIFEIFPEQWTRSIGPLPSLRLLRKLDKFKPEVIYSDVPIYSTWYAKLHNLLRKNQTKLISRLHGDPWLELQDSLSRTLGDLRSLPLSEALYIMLRNPYVYFLFERTLRASDRIVTACHWLKERVQIRLKSKPFDVVYQPIDPASFFEDGEFDFKHPNIGILQNMLVPLKIDGLLAFRSVTKRLKDVHFYIGGNGPCFPQVKHHFKNLENVHILGHVKNFRRFYASIDVYTLPSGLDCCPITLLEASYLGKSILGSKIGGIPEIIIDGVTGWSIRNRDTDQWVNKISLLLQDEKLAKRMGRAGKVRVEEYFTWNVVSKQIAEILTGVAEKG